MKTREINIDKIKRYPTVTNPIKADDISTPQAYAYTLRRAIVTDCTEAQRAELVTLLDGKETAEGVTFQNTTKNRDRLHSWQNRQSRQQRAAILGDGWQWIDGTNSGTEPGDLITCIDGTQGRVTKSDPESCVIEFETEDGQRLTVAGYFRKDCTPLENSGEITEADEDTPAPFFTPGTRYRCIKAVKDAFTAGNIYEQSSDPTRWHGYFRNDKGTLHVWPQPAEIAHSCELHDMQPADIDPRNYFEPVSE